jgi:hypothetical protein
LNICFSFLTGFYFFNLAFLTALQFLTWASIWHFSASMYYYQPT